MLAEFLQLLFFVFYKIVFMNRFSLNTAQYTLESSLTQPATSNTSNSNSSAIQDTSGLSALASAEAQLINQHVTDTRLFEMQDYFKFINFELYAFNTGSSDQYVMAYMVLVGVFYLMMLVLILLSTRLFNAAKRENLEESTKALMKGLSFVLFLYINLLQIPFVVVLLQGFLCSEDPNQDYTIP